MFSKRRSRRQRRGICAVLYSSWLGSLGGGYTVVSDRSAKPVTSACWVEVIGISAAFREWGKSESI